MRGYRNRASWRQTRQKSRTARGNDEIPGTAVVISVTAAITRRGSEPYATPTLTSMRRFMSLSVQLTSFSGQQRAVRHDDISTFERRQRRRAHADLAHGARRARDLDDIAWLYRPLEHQDQPETKLLTTFCRPKPMPTPERAKDDWELADFEAGRRERHQQSQQDEA